MITINLRPGAKRAAGSPLDRVKDALQGIGSKVKEPMLLLAVAVVVVIAGVLLWIGIGISAERNQLEPRLEAVSQESRRFRNIVAQKRREETIRDSLFSQIQVIRTVDGDRYVWPHVMDEVAKALPPYTWLVTIQPLSPSPAAIDSIDATVPLDLRFQIDGRTVDIQAYTRFLRQLEASPWIRNVEPVSARTVVESDRPVTAFSIRALFNRADSAYIRTVPLSQSVR
ncbi:MAG: PilN domain-containing protein [Gemmatimonadales bacterium]